MKHLCFICIIAYINKKIKGFEKKLKTGSFDAFADEAESVTEEKDYELVRSKTVILKPESVDEAILQMNLVGHQFYMFLNEEHGDISVVYRRNDGGYGLITPEVE